MQGSALRKTDSDHLTEERNNLVLEHLPLVRAMAVQIHKNLPDHVDLDDLVQSGTLGLLDAASKYDSQTAVSFGAYAKYRIRGSILDTLRQADWASREVRRRQRQLKTATLELSTALQRAPTEAEIAGKMGMSLEYWQRMMLDIGITFISPSSGSDNDQDSVPRELADKAEGWPEKVVARKQLSEVLGRAIGTLHERERTMLFLYYDEEYPMSQISRILGVHKSRTSQIHKTAVQKLGKVLRSAGINSSQAC
jgi:RNA polymerase sigma factor for flagellar operon FliA